MEVFRRDFKERLWEVGLSKRSENELTYPVRYILHMIADINSVLFVAKKGKCDVQEKNVGGTTFTTNKRKI